MLWRSNKIEEVGSFLGSTALQTHWEALFGFYTTVAIAMGHKTARTDTYMHIVGGKNKEEAYRGFESYKMEELVTLETLVEFRNCFFIQEFTLLV